MTEEEQKEFEEFIQWKAEKAKKESLKDQSENKVEEVKDEVVEPTNENVNKETPQSSSPQEPKKDEFSLLPIFIGVIAIVILIIAVATCGGSKKSASAEEDYTEVVDSVAVDTVEPDGSAIPAEPDKKTWSFSFNNDPMSDTKNIWARIQSDDYISQEFPYEGLTYSYITVRYMKKYGYDVIIEISKGQINGRSYYGTDYVTARFDEGSPKKYYFNEAADGSSNVIFLRNSSDFIKKCKSSKDIKIDIPVYKYGRPVFSFHVDEPLVWREE